MASPDDLLIDAPGDCCWAAERWDDASECSVQSAEGRSRAKARAAYSSYVDDWTEIGVWKRYIQPFTRQDAWTEWGRDLQADRTYDSRAYYPASVDVVGRRFEEIFEGLSERVPDDWDPGYDVENYGSWRFVPRGTPGAWPVWVCGPAIDGPPPNPKRQATTNEEGRTDG